MAKQHVKVDNPGQLERVNSYIERCRELQRPGPRTHFMKGREQLLRDIQEELKQTQTVGRSTLNRSNTTFQKSRSEKSTVRKRRSSDVAAMAKVKLESDQDLTSSLPRGIVFKTKRSVEERPKILGLLSRNTSLSRKRIISKPGLSTIEDSPKRAGNTTSSRLRTRRKDTKSRTLPPPLKMTQESLEYSGDIEDVEQDGVVVGTVEESLPPSGRHDKWEYTPLEDGNTLVIPNTANVPDGVSPALTRKKAVSFESSNKQQLVTVEVHEDPEKTIVTGSSPGWKSQGEEWSNMSSVDRHHHITSETKLLSNSPNEYSSSRESSPSTKRKGNKRKTSSGAFPKRKLSLSQPNVTGDERDRLIEEYGKGSPYFKWENRPSDDESSLVKTYSLDRKLSNGTRRGRFPNGESAAAEGDS